MILFFFDTLNPCFFFEAEVFDFLRLVAINKNKPLSYKFTLPKGVGDVALYNFWNVNNTSYNCRNQ